MAENKFALRIISHLRKVPKVIYEKPFETREEAEEYKEIIVPIMTAAKGNMPEFKKIEFAVEEIQKDRCGQKIQRSGLRNSGRNGIIQ